MWRVPVTLRCTLKISCFHESVKFYNPYIWSFISNETDGLLTLRRECADSNAASCYVCVMGRKCVVWCDCPFPLITCPRLIFNCSFLQPLLSKIIFCCFFLMCRFVHQIPCFFLLSPVKPWQNFSVTASVSFSALLSAFIPLLY